MMARFYTFSKLRTFMGVWLLFCSSYMHSQSAINILDLYHDSFSEQKARIVTAEAQIGDINFHINVGGVSFQSVAVPAERLKNETVSLDFADNRLVVKIGTDTYRPDLPVWQLSPIISFANSAYNVAVTQQGDTVGNRGAKCRFHPAFLDNLLGLRLFQADLLNMTDIIWDIPIDARRDYILARSEQGFKPVWDPSLHRTIYEKLVSGEFTSFSLTDKDINFVFDTGESGLILSGKPYYYFVKTELDMANIQLIRKQLIDCYKDIDAHAKILLKNEYTPDIHPRTNLGGLLNALSKQKQLQVFNPYSMFYIEKAILKLDSLNNLTDDEIGIRFKSLDNFSDSFKQFWDLLKKNNPLVYQAVENTAQWSAFFRYVRKANPDNWAQFVKKAESESKWDAPAVRTPTSAEINYFRYFEERDKK